MVNVLVNDMIIWLTQNSYINMYIDLYIFSGDSTRSKLSDRGWYRRGQMDSWPHDEEEWLAMEDKILKNFQLIYNFLG